MLCCDPDLWRLSKNLRLSWKVRHLGMVRKNSFMSNENKGTFLNLKFFRDPVANVKLNFYCFYERLSMSERHTKWRWQNLIWNFRQKRLNYGIRHLLKISMLASLSEISSFQETLTIFKHRNLQKLNIKKEQNWMVVNINVCPKSSLTKIFARFLDLGCWVFDDTEFDGRAPYCRFLLAQIPRP